MPVCVYCGTPRPADESSCPTCGRAWIDVRVDDGDEAGAAGVAAAGAAASEAVPERAEPATEAESADPAPPTEDTTPTVPIVPPPMPGALDDTGEFSFDDWTLPPEKPRSRARWIIPILLLIAVVVVWVFVFVDRGTTPTTTVAAAPTTTEATTTTVATTTTTVPETTTTTAVTTTTTAVPPPSVWPPVGDPIPADELDLKAAGIGPIEIGTGIEEVAGRLTASLGEAEASGDDNLCPVGEAYWLQWGELRAVFDGFESGATFVSYYYEDVGSETSLGLTTLSGLALGDTVEDLLRIYASFTVAFEVIDGVEVFRLIDGAELLLWGPVTSSDPDGIVEGIYSPGPCSDV